MTLDIDGNTRYALYTSGSGTSALTFTYNATAGDVDLDGIGIASTTLDVNGGTLTDLNGNPISNLAFTPPANIGSVFVNYPSLSLDFIYDADGRYTLNGTVYNDLTSFLTASGGSFTRASTATYYGSTGTLQNAASGVPRFDYNPSTLAPRGILIEESRTNIVLDSAQITTANYSNENMTLTADVTTAPDGTLSADKAIDNATNLRHIFLSKQASLTTGTKYTGSMYLKAAEQQYVQLIFGTAVFGSNAYANFLLSGSGSVTFTGSSVVATSITSIGNGWYRCTLTATATATATDFHIFAALLNNTNNTTRTPAYTGTGGGIYVWGIQNEAGAFATSYIPTSASAVTRSSDNLSVPTGAWFDSTEGTIFGQVVIPYVGAGTYPGSVTLDDGTGSNAIHTFMSDASGDAKFSEIFNGGVTQFSNSAGTYVAGNVLKQSLSYTTNSARIAMDGTLGTLDTTVTLPTVNTFRAGRRRGAGDPLNGWVQKARYYPARISDTQIQLLTQ
ncbi:MAG: hypothetical protein WC043_05035 [Pseudobdellovibrionaceae bacterium]